MKEASLCPGMTGWIIGLVTAILVHVLLAMVVFWSPQLDLSGQAIAAGTGGVEIALGPAGRAEGGPETAPAESEAEEIVEPAPEPQQQPEAAPEPVAQTKPEPQAVPLTQTQAKPPAEPAAQPVASTEASQTTPPQSTLTGSAGNSGSKQADNTGSGDNSSGGGLPGDSRDYAATLLAWLERHKEYPRRARWRRQQGTVLLYFMVDQQGNVLDHRIEESSGYPALDEEVRGMIKRAQPLPAMPESMDKQTLELVVPVQFFLRR